MADSIDYGPLIADLERRKAEIEQALATIRSLPGTPAEAISAPPGSNGATSLARHQLFGMKVPEAIRTYLDAVKQPQTAAQIAAGIVRHGWSTTSSTPSNTVRTALIRLAESGVVVQLKDKTWGLVPWFPGINKGKRADDKGATTRKKRSPYHAFIAEKMSQGMSMKDAAAAYKKQQTG